MLWQQNRDTSLKFQEIYRLIEDLYARLYHCYVRSIEFVSILK